MLSTPVSLLDRLREPNAGEAWVRFVHLYTPVLYDWSQSFGLQAQDASDLVQDVFVRLIQQLPAFRYDPDKSFRAWLKTVLLNLWRNQCRKRRLECMAGAAVPEVPAAEPETGFTEEEYRQRLVGRAMELMQTDFQPLTWQAFWNCTVLGKPAAVVATELGMSLANVYVAKSRVLARLRQELAGLLD